MTVSSPARTISVAALAILLTAAGQFCLRHNGYSAGLIFLGFSLLPIWYWTRRSPSASEESGNSRSRESSRHPIEFIASAIAMVLVLVLQHFDRGYTVQVASWLAAIACLAVAGASPCSESRRDAGPILILMGLSLLLRIYDLEFYPTGLHGDEGSFGAFSARLARGERIAPFSVGWDFHSTLFHSLQAAAISTFGQTAAAIRIPSAILGASSIPIVFRLLRSRGGFWPAAGASLLLSTLPWHLYFSRCALDDIAVALCVSGALAADLERQRRAAPMAAGIWLGLSLYAGNKAVMLPAMLTAGVLVRCATGQDRWRDEMEYLGKIALVAAFVAAPQLAYYVSNDWYGPLLSHPISRLAGSRTSAGATTIGPSLVLTQVERSLLAFQFYRDQSIFLGFTRVPLLPPVVGGLAWIGFVLCLLRRHQRFATTALTWFSVGLLGSILTNNPPQAHHLTPMIVLPILFAAVVLIEIVSSSSLRPRLAAAIVGFVTVVACLDSANELRRYYLQATPWLEVTEIARAMRHWGKDHDVVLVTLPMMETNGTLQYLAGDVATTKQYDELKEPPLLDDRHDTAILVSPRRAEEIPKLRQWFPHAREAKYGETPGTKLLTIFEIPHR